MPRVAIRGRVWTAKARQHWAATHTDGHPRSSSRGGPQTLVESHAFRLWTWIEAHSGIVLGDHFILLEGHVIRVGVHSKPSWRPTHIEWAPISRWIGRPHTLCGLPRLRIVDDHHVSSLTLWTATHIVDAHVHWMDANTHTFDGHVLQVGSQATHVYAQLNGWTLTQLTCTANAVRLGCPHTVSWADKIHALDLHGNWPRL